MMSKEKNRKLYNISLKMSVIVLSIYNKNSHTRYRITVW